jgi:hypothetical protein
MPVPVPSANRAKVSAAGLAKVNVSEPVISERVRTPA